MDQLFKAQVEELINGCSKNPHAVLGMHFENDQTIIRCFNPNSASVVVKEVHTSKTFDMEIIDERGLFECRIPGNTEPFLYELVHTTKDNHKYSVIDPYAFLPTVSDYDTWLFNQGNNHRIYEKLGSHLTEVNGVKGASFAVWAPMAQRVSVVGTFNQWDGRIHPMRLLGSSGVWELFIPGLVEGDIYKYEIKTPSGEIYIKADPYAFYAEKPLKPHP